MNPRPAASLFSQVSLLADVWVMLQWLTAREYYHRLLKEIMLQVTRNNTNIKHYYEYINFRADSQPAAVFDPCALAPKVTHAS